MSIHHLALNKSQVMHTAFPFNAPTTYPTATTSTSEEDVQLAMALSASLHSAMEEGVPVGAITSAGASSSVIPSSTIVAQNDHASSSLTSEIDHASSANPTPPSPPSAPPIPSAPSPPSAPEDGKVHYPSIDVDPVPAEEEILSAAPEPVKKGGEEQSSTCVVCLDAPVEGACVPCGHMAGCMSCLEGIKAKKWGCPICRSKIDQIIRVYSV